MELSRVDALLEKLEQHKNRLETVDFRVEISDFTVIELEALSANLDRAIPRKPLSIH